MGGGSAILKRRPHRTRFAALFLQRTSMPTQQGMNGLQSRCGRDDTPGILFRLNLKKSRTPEGMGEISASSRRAENSIWFRHSGKRIEMDGRSHSKDDKRKCSGIGICGTTEQSKRNYHRRNTPDQMMDFYLKWKNL